MSVFTIPPQPRELLLPFYDLPALRLLVGFHETDGNVLYSDDINVVKEFNVSSAPTFMTVDTAHGCAFADFDGTDDGFYCAHDPWMDITGALTMGAIVMRSSASISFWRIHGHAGRSDDGEMTYWFGSGDNNNKLEFTCASDGTTGTTKIASLTNGLNKMEPERNFVAARYTPGSAIKLWGNDLTTNDTTSVPASLHTNTEVYSIGYRPQSATPGQFWNGGIALVWLCAGLVTDNRMAELIAHCKRLGMA